MPTPDDEDVQLAKEDFVAGIIAGMDAEDADAFIASSDFARHAAHFARMSKLGRRADAGRVAAEYLKAVAEDDPDADELEKELGYEPPASSEGTGSGEYDGRDDEFIAEMAKLCAEP